MNDYLGQGFGDFVHFAVKELVVARDDDYSYCHSSSSSTSTGVL